MDGMNRKKHLIAGQNRVGINNRYRISFPASAEKRIDNHLLLRLPNLDKPHRDTMIRHKSDHWWND